jgi:hypothetical protein
MLVYRSGDMFSQALITAANLVIGASDPHKGQC